MFKQFTAAPRQIRGARAASNGQSVTVQNWHREEGGSGAGNKVEALAARRCEREVAAAMVAAAAQERPIVSVEEGDEQETGKAAQEAGKAAQEAGKAAQEARRVALEVCRNEQQQATGRRQAGGGQEAAPPEIALPEAKEQTKYGKGRAQSDRTWIQSSAYDPQSSSKKAAPMASWQQSEEAEKEPNGGPEWPKASGISSHRKRAQKGGVENWKRCRRRQKGKEMPARAPPSPSGGAPLRWVVCIQNNPPKRTGGAPNIRPCLDERGQGGIRVSALPSTTSKWPRSRVWNEGHGGVPAEKRAVVDVDPPSNAYGMRAEAVVEYRCRLDIEMRNRPEAPHPSPREEGEGEYIGDFRKGRTACMEDRRRPHPRIERPARKLWSSFSDAKLEVARRGRARETPPQWATTNGSNEEIRKSRAEKSDVRTWMHVRIVGVEGTDKGKGGRHVARLKGMLVQQSRRHYDATCAVEISLGHAAHRGRRAAAATSLRLCWTDRPPGRVRARHPEDWQALGDGCDTR
ncbi:hypothetical protein DFH08DRAFT_817766 [Mycena albidolilacea]|uniref:Uncharacterized protein n=1 Tax=Mycena albidolilacea TaxID=1033008 RepID=A0AAD6ZHK6_9AGAR|nr:hypothetical protein DFH08DRAFT_817766 [Mycena albidolilacea]